MKVIDLHQDILYHRRGGGGVPADSQTSFRMLQSSDVHAVFASVFVNPNKGSVESRCLRIADELLRYSHATEQWGGPFDYIGHGFRLAHVLNANRTGLLFHLEGMYAWGDDGLVQLEDWRRNFGLRSLAIVWNKSNELGGGCSEPSVGLTSDGRRVIEWCEQNGVLIDLAHANERTFWDVINASIGPVLVSHSCAAGVRKHVRNLTDEQLQAIASRGGVVGITFVNGFVVKTGRATVAHVADHIEYVRDAVGLSHVAIGSDFGGILGRTPVGLETVELLPNLWAELSCRGWRDDDIEFVAWRNAARVISAVLR